MASSDKTPIPSRVYQDIERIVRDLETLAQAAKSWPADSPARAQLRQLRREMLAAHGSCLRLMQAMAQQAEALQAPGPAEHPSSSSARLPAIPKTPGGNRRVPPAEAQPQMVVRVASPQPVPSSSQFPRTINPDIADMKTRADGVSLSDIVTVDSEAKTDDPGIPPPRRP